MKALAVVFSLVLPVLLSVPTAARTTWHVDDDALNDPGPGDPMVKEPLADGSADHPFDAIQQGIDAAADGDTVIVADGTYTGAGNRDLEFNGKAITVRSENGAEKCIIDCQGSEDDPHRGFYFSERDDLNPVVQGFTITNGYAGHGGGVFCRNGSPLITHNIITGNEAFVFGGGGIPNHLCSSSRAAVSSGLRRAWSRPIRFW